jgi:RND superfamily putative drug exporter
LAPENRGQISRDQRSVLVQFDIKGDSSTAEDRVDPILNAVAQLDRAHPQLRIEEFGSASADKALTKAFQDDFRKAEFLSLPITLVILVLAFGALVAAGIPLLLGLSAVAITLGLLAPLSQLAPFDEAISSVILLVGLAVGVDYSMFYIRRERDERAAGRGKEAALDLAAATSGRAVLISGCTVMVAMAGMYVTGNATFQSFATGTILVVAVAMIGSLTVVPALLSKLGDNVNKGRVPFINRLHRQGAESGFWAAIVGRVLRHPWISLVLAGGLLVVLALPALRLHTANSGVQGLPRDLPVMQTYDRIQAAFPGEPLAATIALKAPDVTTIQVTAAIRELRNRAVATGLMRDPVTTVNSRDKTVAQISVPMAGDGTDDTSNRALQTLRSEVIPQTIGRLPGAQAPVTGLTAGSFDFNELIKSRAPWVFVFVLSLAFLLLLVTFRSIVIPAKAIVLNLLSVGAAYGVLVWIFQDGHLESLLGFTSIGGITSWLPLFLFVILFGLSMDYHVFILSRVRGGVRPRDEQRRGRRPRHPLDRGRRYERGCGDGRRVLGLRDAQLDRLQGDGRRAGARRTHRRDDRARRSAARQHEAARRLELVPTVLAAVAARRGPRAHVPPRPGALSLAAVGGCRARGYARLARACGRARPRDRAAVPRAPSRRRDRRRDRRHRPARRDVHRLVRDRRARGRPAARAPRGPAARRGHVRGHAARRGAAHRRARQGPGNHLGCSAGRRGPATSAQPQPGLTRAHSASKTRAQIPVVAGVTSRGHIARSGTEP